MLHFSSFKLASSLLLFSSFCTQGQVIYEEVTPFGKALESVGLAKIYGDHALTIEQLKECSTLFTSAKILRATIDVGKKNHDKNLKKVADLDRSIAQTQVNEYSQASVKKYNRLIDEYERLWAVIEQFESQREARRETYNEHVKKTNKMCSNKNYYQEDLEQALQDLKASNPNN